MLSRLGEGAAPISHIDNDVMLSELYSTFQVRVELEVLYRGENVQVVGRGVRVEPEPDPDTVLVAYSRVSIRSTKTLDQLVYKVLWDLYMQFDRLMNSHIPLPKDASEARRPGRPRRAR